MLNAPGTDQDTEDWVKSAMSVCGLSLSQRSKSMTPQPRKDIVVIPQAALSQEGDSSASCPDDDEDSPSDRSESVSPALSEVREIDHLCTADNVKSGQSSPRSIVSWTEDGSKGKVPNTCHTHDVRIHSDIRIHNELGTVTASMPADLKRSLEMGIGTNFSKRLSGLGSSTYDSKVWNSKSKNENRGVLGAGLCMNPRTRRDYLNDVFKVGSFSNARKLDNVDLDVRLAVRQQFYDQWARPKRGRYINFENRALRKSKPEDYTVRNTVKFKEFRKARTKLDDFLSGDTNDSVLKPVSSVEIKVPKTADKVKKETTPVSANQDIRKQKSEEREPEVEVDDKDAMNLTYGDIDTIKIMDINERRGLISHSFLEPFTFDKRTETAPMFVAYRGAYDMSALRLSDSRANRTSSRKEDDRILCDIGNASGRYPWNKYHIFHFPVKSSQCPITRKPMSEKQEKHVNKENSHLLKIPLIPSKTGPVFTSNDSMCVSITSSKTEDNLLAIRNKYCHAIHRDSQHPGYPVNGVSGTLAEGEISPLVSQSAPVTTSRNSQQDRFRILELSSRASVKNRASGASGSRMSTSRLDSGLDISSLMVRGETKLSLE